MLTHLNLSMVVMMNFIGMRKFVFVWKQMTKKVQAKFKQRSIKKAIFFAQKT